MAEGVGAGQDGKKKKRESAQHSREGGGAALRWAPNIRGPLPFPSAFFTHFLAHETELDLDCGLLLEKKKRGRSVTMTTATGVEFIV